MNEAILKVINENLNYKLVIIANKLANKNTKTAEFWTYLYFYVKT